MFSVFKGLHRFAGLSVLLICVVLLGEFSSRLRWDLRRHQLGALGETSSFVWDDIELVSLQGVGDISIAFKSRIPKLCDDKMYVTKITSERYLHYSTTEIKFMKILNEPPTISNIPPLLLAIESMANPFANWEIQDLTALGCSKHHARWLKRQTSISAQVQPLLQDTGKPNHTNLPELVRFMRSLLQGLHFAHSRNVMHCDLHSRNVFYNNETGTAFLFDWNAAFLFKPNSVFIHYHKEPKKLTPPEGEGNANATHATVSAFDIWSLGRLLSKLLCGYSKCSPLTTTLEQQQQQHANNDNSTKKHSLLLWQAYDLVAQMQNPDPYQRPDTGTLLGHPFFLVDRNDAQ